MRLINRKEFLNLTPPFLYATLTNKKGFEYDSLNICTEIIDNDWFYTSVTGEWSDWDGKDLMTVNFTPIIDEDGDYFSSRDGFYNENDLFIVWDKQDVKYIIKALKRCL